MFHSKNLLTFSSLIFLSACGHYSAPESFEAKMARYQVKHSGSGIVPNIESINFNTRGSSRAPASVVSEGPSSEDIGFSNKKLYFITLYNQYNKLQSFSSAGPREITQCPSFHSALVDHSKPLDGRTKFSPNYQFDKLSDDNYVRYFPELYLSMDQSHQTPRVLDFIRKNAENAPELIQKAIDLHVDKTHAELAEMCEYGSSDNYYVFENLNTEIKRRSVTSPGATGMSILLRTTVFSNKALIESLSRNKATSRAPASAGLAYDYEYEVMKRLGVVWAKGYYQTLKVGPQ